MISSEKKQRRAHFCRRVANDLPACLALQFFAGMLMAPLLQVLVRVFNHHHRGIDHGTDGDGDAAQRHDVGVHPLVAQHD